MPRLPEEEIEKQVAAFRKAQLEKLADGAQPKKKQRPDDRVQDSHSLAKAIEKKTRAWPQRSG